MTTTRRQFLTALTAGGGALTASVHAQEQGAVVADGAEAAEARATEGAQLQAPKTDKGRYRPGFRIGLGGAPIGGSSGLPVTNAESLDILESAWNAGVRFYDTSPFYGYGLSERRFGSMLQEKPRGEYVLSTKVGRVFTAAADAQKAALGGWANPLPFKYKYDYSAEGTRRSVEDSLQRLGLSSIDIVFIHDLSPDNKDLGADWTKHFDEAAKGAMPELIKMKEEGIIKAWGLGVNTLDPILKTFEVSDADLFLCACNYTLIDHEAALEKVFPLCEQKDVTLVIGSPLNNGFLAGRNRFNYSGNPPTEEQLNKRGRMLAVAQRHKVDLRTAALQFCAAPKVVSSVIPGARSAKQPRQNVTSMRGKIPEEFWAELKAEKLIATAAPAPVV